MWLNREEELKALGRFGSGNRVEFLLLYGRRRVGKSELIERFLKSHEGVRLLARQEAEVLQLKHFSRVLAGYFRDNVLNANPFSNWDAFFTYLAEKAKGSRLVVALDEFPYLVEGNRSLPSILQHHWDERLRKTKIFLILCGSSIGMMESFMGSRSPLYGRRTAQMLLKPFRFVDALPWLGEVQSAVEAYAVFGGTPAYLLEYDRKMSLWRNIKEKVLSPERALYKDPEFVLRQEVREPRAYFSILESVAKGNTRIGAIMNDTGLDKSTVGKYIAVLTDLHLLEREVPITEKSPMKSRKGIYRLSDHYFRFWFRFVYPNLQAVEEGQQGQVVEKVIQPGMSQFVGLSFEDIVQEALEVMGKAGELPIKSMKIGRWWDKNVEIDLVGIGERGNLFCEVKWSRGVDAARILRELEQKVSRTGLSGKAHYCVVARSFAGERPKGCLCLDMKAVERALKMP